jgi:hypothetical protein
VLSSLPALGLGEISRVLMVSARLVVPAQLVDAKALAAGYGVQALLDKRNLSGNMIPAIMTCRAHSAVKGTDAPHAALGITSSSRVI